MGFKQHISRTWQMIEQQVNDVPFRPDHEVFGQINHHKTGAPFLGRPFVLLDRHLNARWI